MQNKAVDILTSQGHFYIELGLDRIKQILNLLDNPQDKLKCIHVAGTNGKGSVCSIISNVLTRHNYKVGLFTSPHIFDYRERIRINGIKISEYEFENLIINITKLANKNCIHLTEFEILTASAFTYFNNNNVDYVVLETGLGGRFDATNVIKENICSIITHLDLEHTDRLGNTIDKIAFEKAGIIKENCPVIIGENNPVIIDIAKEKNSKIFYSTPSNKKCSLVGEHQNFNLGLSLKCLELLNINVFDDDLMTVKNPCRFEYLKDYNTIVDVAHNPNGIEALRKNLDLYYDNQNFNFIFGCLKTKNYKKMLDSLLREKDRLFIYEFNNPNACSYKDIRIINNNAEPFSNFKKDANITVICGSFYMLKELFFDIGIKYDTDR